MKVSPSQLSIIKAGFKVFSELGKTKASMANIAKVAGVSKPLLFHHFGTKDKLYKTCLQFANEQLTMLKQPSLQNPSFIQTLKDIQISKFKLEKTYPGIFKFVTLEQSDVPPIPSNPFTKLDLKRMHTSVNSNQLWRVLYFLTLGYQSALQGNQKTDDLIYDYQQSFAMLETLVFPKEE